MTGEARSFAELMRAGVLSLGDGYRAKKNELGGDGPIFLRSAYLQDSGFQLAEPERFLSVETRQYGPKVSRVGDVVITTKGNSTGRIGKVRVEEADAVYSPHLSYWRTEDFSVLDQQYLYFWAGSQEFKQQLAGMAHGTDMAPYLSLRDQARLRISLPSIEQQRLIGSLLSALDDKIALNRRMNETLEAAARALFRDWFVDFGPTRAKAQGARAWLAPALWSLFPDRLGDDGVPEGWTSYMVGDLTEQHTATINPSASGDEVFEHYSLPAYDVGGSPALDAGDSIKSNKTLIPAGAVLLSKLNPETSRVWLPNDVGTMRQVASTELLAFVPKEPASRSLLFAIFRDDTFRQTMEGMVTGTSKSHQRISPAALRSVEALVGSPAVFAAFERMVEPMLKRMVRNRAESRALTASCDALLPKLMSGEVRVRDAEALVAA